MLKIDIFNHIWPAPFFQALQKVVPNFRDMGKRVTSIPMLMDLELRFRVMDRFDEYVQILSMSTGGAATDERSGTRATNPLPPERACAG